MSYAQRIIEKFGGIRKTARAVGAPPSTVQGWKESGFIPSRQQPLVLEASRRLGIGLAPDDFFDQPTPPAPDPGDPPPDPPAAAGSIGAAA